MYVFKHIVNSRGKSFLNWYQPIQQRFLWGNMHYDYAKCIKAKIMTIHPHVLHLCILRIMIFGIQISREVTNFNVDTNFSTNK